MASTLEINPKEELLQVIADSVSLIVDDEAQLLANFDVNMASFKQHFPEIYQHFRHYEPKDYFLEIKDGFANIFDSANDKYLFQYPHYLECLLDYGIYKRRSAHTNVNLKDESNTTSGFIHLEYLNKIDELVVKRTNEIQAGDFKKLPKSIGSMIVFGIDLGFHIELIVGQHFVSNLYLVEPELDLFFASLFTANWSYLLDSCEKKGINLHIALGVDDETFFDDFQKQSYFNGVYDIVKTFGYIHRGSEKISAIVKNFKERFFELSQGWGFFDDGVMEIGHTYLNLKNNVPILRKPTSSFPDLSENRAIIIGNGPSLDDHFEKIKSLQGSAVLISCGTALSALLKKGIVPDIHVEQERTLPVAEKVKLYGFADIVENILLFAPNTVHPEVYKLFKRKIMAIKIPEPSSAVMLKDREFGKDINGVRYINPTVANTALTLVAELKFAECYFIGVDLGYKLDGKHHSSESMYYTDEGEDLALYSKASAEYRVDGNFGGDFHCDGFFNYSRVFLEKLIEKSPQLTCYNLSDGAKIKGASPVLKDVVLPSKAFNKAQLIENIYQNTAMHYQGSELSERFKTAVNPQSVKRVCQELIKILKEPVSNLEDCIKQLRAISKHIFKLEVEDTMHLSLLLNGTMMYMQATLTNLMFASSKEQQSVDDYVEAREYMIEFLENAPKVYEELYLLPSAIDSDWLKPLKELKMS